jgi:hypothetical protein
VTLPVTPETKVGALLEAYPEVEAVLIACAPAFEKLRNPVLRKTVAKVATLEQAARIGGVSLPQLIQTIREAIGAGGPPVRESQQAPPAAAWLEACKIAHEVDADALLDSGVHPLGPVREALASIAPGEAVRVASSFRPEPLIEQMRLAGFVVHCVEAPGSKHITYIARVT